MKGLVQTALAAWTGLVLLGALPATRLIQRLPWVAALRFDIAGMVVAISVAVALFVQVMTGGHSTEIGRIPYFTVHNAPLLAEVAAAGMLGGLLAPWLAQRLASRRVVRGLRALALVALLAVAGLLAAATAGARQKPGVDEYWRRGEGATVPALSRPSSEIVTLSNVMQQRTPEVARRDTVGNIDVVQSHVRRRWEIAVVERGGTVVPPYTDITTSVLGGDVLIWWDRSAGMGYLQPRGNRPYRFEQVEGQFVISAFDEQRFARSVVTPWRWLVVAALGLALTLGLSFAGLRAGRSPQGATSEAAGRLSLAALAVACLALAPLVAAVVNGWVLSGS